MVSFVPLLLPHDRDFLFYPATQANLTLFMHIVNHQTSKVLVRNTCNKTLRIPHCHELCYLIDIAYNNCFLTGKQSALDVATSLSSSYQPSGRNNNLPFSPTDPSLETVLDNGVKMYGDAVTVRQIADLLPEYPTIWESQSFVQILPDKSMTILLKPGWKSKVSAIKPRIYPLGNKA